MGESISIYHFLKYTQSRRERGIWTEPFCGIVLKSKWTPSFFLPPCKAVALPLPLHHRAKPPVTAPDQWSGAEGRLISGRGSGVGLLGFACCARSLVIKIPIAVSKSPAPSGLVKTASSKRPHDIKVLEICSLFARRPWLWPQSLLACLSNPLCKTVDRLVMKMRIEEEPVEAKKLYLFLPSLLLDYLHYKVTPVPSFW